MNPAERTIRSMTGYGRGAAEAEGVRVEAELRGVNHRFLDLKMKLPAELGSLEPELRARLQKAVGRGRIDLIVSLALAGTRSAQVEVNGALVAEYLRAAAALKKEFRLRGGLALETVLALPGAVSIRAGAEARDGVVPRLVVEAVDRALAAYEAMRTEEGSRLAADLRGHLRSIGQEVAHIDEATRGLPEATARRLRERVEALVRERGLDEVRLTQEVALLADRVDITEELVRLRGHLEQALTALDRPEGPVGKTLDFVMQEMSREANTINSKAEAPPISRAVLRIKSEVEKIREQVQNLE